MLSTPLLPEDILPLTCSRTGTCCHGKLVWLNPWELACLAREKKVTPAKFRDLYCAYGGIQLRFNGKPGWKGQQACSQYVENSGCSVHAGRPLACRLYPLGRQIQSQEVHYMFQGAQFPCLEGCPEVVQLPQLSVGDYLNGQATTTFEKAQDDYLEIMQNLADLAFELLLETGLAESGEAETLQMWQKMGSEKPEELTARIGQDWMDCLMVPAISESVTDGSKFAGLHNELLQVKAQEQFGAISSSPEWHKACVLLMALALHLARGIGADPAGMAEHWIEIAKSHGAKG